MYKYVVGKKQKHLVVSMQVHEMVRMYAKERNLTMVKATYELLKIAFEKVYNLNYTDN